MSDESEWDKCPTCTATKGERTKRHDDGCEIASLRAEVARLTEALRRLYEAVDGAFPLHGSPPRRDWHPDAIDLAQRTLDLLDEVGQ